MWCRQQTVGFWSTFAEYSLVLSAFRTLIYVFYFELCLNKNFFAYFSSNNSNSPENIPKRKTDEFDNHF